MADGFKPCSVDGCNGNAHHSRNGKRGFCNKHYKRWYRHGDPAVRLCAANGEPYAWLLEHANFDGDGCLIWPFGRTSDGYGLARLASEGEVYAHRHMCELAHGPAPEEKPLALHSCGNGHLGCVNPKHLRWGNRSDNTQDALIEGAIPVGVDHHMSRLTPEAVRFIRKHHASTTQRDLADRFGVTPNTVWQVIRNKTWRSVA